MSAAAVPLSRNAGLGASEIASALGLSPWESQLDLVLKKKGQEITLDNEHMAWGRALEPILLDRLRAEVHGVALSPTQVIDVLELPAERVERFPEHPNQLSIRHSSWPLLWATPDVLMKREGRIEGGEVKNRSPWMMDNYGHGVDGIPVEVALQCHGGMMVTGLKVWHFGAYFGGSRWIRTDVPADPDLYPGILASLSDFWTRHVVGDEPPPVVGRDLETLKRLFPKHERDLILTATEQQKEEILRYTALQEEIKALEAERDTVRANLQAAIGLASGMRASTGLVSWKANKDQTKTNYEALAKELLTAIPPDQVDRYLAAFTTTGPGARPFRVTPPKGTK